MVVGQEAGGENSGQNTKVLAHHVQEHSSECSEEPIKW